MPNEVICPYCFYTFRFQKVHFQIEMQSIDSGIIDRKADKSKFQLTVDPLYRDHWIKYAATAAHADYSKARLPAYPVDEVGVFDTKSMEIDDDGFIRSICDLTRNKCENRVCPKCHNSLPGQYGKYPIKFITVVGRKSAGKSIYLRQLFARINSYAAKVGMAANILGDATRLYMQNNKVDSGLPTPSGTVSDVFEQPLFCNLKKQSRSIGIEEGIVETLVFFDIAGENLLTEKSLNMYGQFVRQSSALIFLIPPEDACNREGHTDSELVAEVIQSSCFRKTSNIPVAIVLSMYDQIEAGKPDLLLQQLEGVPELSDSTTVLGTKKYQQVFNKQAHEDLKVKLNKNHSLSPAMIQQLLSFGENNVELFACSATGSAIIQGEDWDVFAADMHPIRIEEPFYWILSRFGILRVMDSFETVDNEGSKRKGFFRKKRDRS